jgi:hypothetical protein
MLDVVSFTTLGCLQGAVPAWCHAYYHHWMYLCRLPVGSKPPGQQQQQQQMLHKQQQQHAHCQHTE